MATPPCNLLALMSTSNWHAWHMAEEVEEFPAVEYGDVDHTAIDSALEEMIIGAVKEGFDTTEM